MKALYRNFGHPRGVLGWLVGHAMARKNRERSAWALSRLAPQAGERTLEIGFGPGVDVARLAAAVGADGFVAGIDPSREMLRQARRRNRAAIREGRVDLRPGSAGALPFAGAGFDAVLSVNSAFFWPDLGAAMGEIARVLRPRGRVLVVLQPLWKGAVPADAAEWGERVARAMADAGLAKAEAALEKLGAGVAVGVMGRRPGHHAGGEAPAPSPFR